jgi:ribosomal protein S21
MSLEVSLRDGESQESLLRRFQKTVQMSGVLRDFKTHQHFISKGESDRIKAKNSARKKRRNSFQQNKFSK